MDWYLNWVSANPLISASIQFGILGTIGEIIPFIINNKKVGLPCKWWQMILKMIAWALLGIIIKYGFVGMRGFCNMLLEHNMLPAFVASGIPYAFVLSFFTNVLFGPQMMAFHRIEDNIILNRWSFKGIERAWMTLLWFWIPAHTVTFSLPKDYQIGLAALWSVALGIILGTANKK